MINTNVVKKYVKRRIEEGFIPEEGNMRNEDHRVKKIESQILAIKLGFKGINNNLIDLIRPNQVLKANGVLIFDSDLDANCGSIDTFTAPFMGRVIKLNGSDAYVKIVGFGNGTDPFYYSEEPVKVGDFVNVDLNEYQALIRVNSFGSGYYLKKANKDNRTNMF